MNWIENVLIIAGVSLDIFAAMECQGALVAKVDKKQLSVICALIAVWQLCALALGFVAGVGPSIRAIRVALKKYRSQMVWLILGLMAGSLYAIAMGPAGLDTPLPPVWVQNFSVPGFLLGVLILLGLDALRRKTARKKSGA